MSLLEKWGLVEAEKPKVQPQPVAAPVAAAPAMTGSANDEYVAKITENVKAKTPDNPYFKLRAGMDVLIAGKLDEVSAAKGAAAMLGAQIQTIVNIGVVGPAIDEAITLIASEKADFMATVYKGAVDAADALTASATDLQAQIKNLLEQVKQLSELNISTQAEASKAHGDAEVLAATFDASASKLTNMLTAEKQKLTTYLS